MIATKPKTEVIEKREAVEEVLLIYYERLYRLALRYVKNEADALDVVQESAYKAVKEAEQITDLAAAKTWVYRIVVNTALSLLRKNQRLTSLTEVTEPAADARYHDADLERAVSDLNEAQKTVLRLRFFEDLKLEEIAAVTGEKTATVKSRLYRTLSELKEKLA